MIRSCVPQYVCVVDHIFNLFVDEDHGSVAVGVLVLVVEDLIVTGVELSTDAVGFADAADSGIKSNFCQ